MIILHCPHRIDLRRPSVHEAIKPKKNASRSFEFPREKEKKILEIEIEIVGGEHGISSATSSVCVASIIVFPGPPTCRFPNAACSGGGETRQGRGNDVTCMSVPPQKNQTRNPTHIPSSPSFSV